MTNEEAIKIINDFPNYKPWEVEALAMAIKALESQSNMQDCEHCIHTYGTLGCCDQVHNEWVYDCDFGQEQFEKRRFLNEYLRKWLSSFNTDSATECFTAVQELKKRLEGENEDSD